MKKQTKIGKVLPLIWLVLLTGCFHRLQVIESEPTKPRPDYCHPPRKIWQTKISTPVREALPLNDRQLLIATYRGELFLLDIQTGKRISRYWTPYRRPVQILLHDRIEQQLYIAGANETKIFRYDLRNGKVIGNWRLDGLWGNMVVLGEDYYAIQREKLLLRLDAHNLQIRASTQLPARCVVGPFVDGKGLLILLTEDGHLRYFDRNLKGRDVIALNLNQAPVVCLQNDTLLAADSKGRIVGIYNEKIFCSFEFGKAIFSRPIIAGEMAFVAFADGKVVGLNLKTGETIWQRQNAGLINLPLQWRQGFLFIPLADGKILALDAQNGTCLYELDAGHPLKTVVISDNSVVAIRRDKQIVGWQW